MSKSKTLRLFMPSKFSLMTDSVLSHIKKSVAQGKKLLAILIDPQSTSLEEIPELCKRIDNNKADFIFVGGSDVTPGLTETIVKEINTCIAIPIVLFPGDYTQITKRADALLFLSLLSGRNPEYLIEQQIKAVPLLKETSLEVIPTGYILIDGGVSSSVIRVSKTKPIAQHNTALAVDTAIAGMYKGKKLIYLEAGSGAKEPVNMKLLAKVKRAVTIPVIVGGGIRTKEQLNNAYANGADLVVIGTAFENNTFIP